MRYKPVFVGAFWVLATNEHPAYGDRTVFMASYSDVDGDIAHTYFLVNAKLFRSEREALSHTKGNYLSSRAEISEKDLARIQAISKGIGNLMLSFNEESNAEEQIRRMEI